ncbi:MAG TPA: exodeoxyribonuclease VII large subunit [Clostridiales bacterium]|nr:exodeoxyribonuclease VII large subunit [Clostridiales bacterium]
MNRVYTVTQVNQYVKNLFVEDLELNYISVQGEVSNCKYHTSGHIYFTLKDGFGQISCVMFAGHRRGLGFRLEEGQNVITTGNVSVYERDGKYQLYAIKIELDGQGLLFEKYEKLKRNLELEGLFDETFKKPIIKYPETVGIVTAKTGAAIQDIINISKRRNPNVQLILYPAQVQGIGAAESIVKGIKALDNMKVDTIIIGRGGGSIEDLWAFNEEIVARAIYNSKTPIISAIGHETDFTIADFVSDLRAPTPSAAAELAVNDFLRFTENLDDYKKLITRIIRQKTDLIRRQIREYEIRIDHASPEYQIKQKRQNLIDIDNKLNGLIYEKIKNNKHLVELYATKLEGLSPLTRLKKGYALVTDQNYKPVLSSKDVKIDSEINISFIDGEITARVIKHN